MSTRRDPYSGQLVYDGAAHVINGSAPASDHTDVGALPFEMFLHNAVAPGTKYNMPGGGRCTFHIVGNTAHAGTSTVHVEVSNDITFDTFVSVGNVSVTGSEDADVIAIDAPYAYVRSNCTAFGSAGNVRVNINY